MIVVGTVWACKVPDEDNCMSWFFDVNANLQALMKSLLVSCGTKQANSMEEISAHAFFILSTNCMSP